MQELDYSGVGVSPLGDDISSLELIHQMGSDLSVVNAARVSYGKRSEGFGEKDLKLIAYLMKNHHGSPFEHVTYQFRVRAPLFVVHQWERHRMACLPGSAMISVGTPANRTNKPIGKIYADWKEGSYNCQGYTLKIPNTQRLGARTLNLETGLIEWTRMTDVYRAGVKPLMRVSLGSGHELTCTPEHRVWTEDGWQTAGELTSASLVGRQGHVVRGEPLGIPKRLREGIQVWTTEQKWSMVKAQDTCYRCGNLFPYDELALDHVVPVAADLTRALDTSNLAPACTACHRAKTNEEQALSRRRKQTLGVRFERVTGLHSAGKEMTYDIAMPPPWHNFLADGVVVHNSYNEESGRYIELRGDFYVPDDSDNAGLYAQAAQDMWWMYRQLLKKGEPKERARMVLTAQLYKEFWWTVNARSLMNFLALRNDEHAQWEIRQYAIAIEKIFSERTPAIFLAFINNERIAP